MNCCFKYHKYNYTLCCMRTTSRISQFFCYDFVEDILALVTFAKNFGFLAGAVSKIFAIENALQSKNQFLRNAFRKSCLCRHLTITIAHKNLILEIVHSYYANSMFFSKKYISQIFFKDKQPQNLLCLFFSGKLLKKLISTSMFRHHL